MTRAGTKWHAVVFRRPADAATGPGQLSLLLGVSCSGTTHRTAVGYYAATTAG